jgi:catalase (peroxidase I)
LPFLPSVLVARPAPRSYTAVASEMEKVSALKQRIDESKGKTLNEISRIVDDINAVRDCDSRGGAQGDHRLSD